MFGLKSLLDSDMFSMFNRGLNKLRVLHMRGTGQLHFLQLQKLSFVQLEQDGDILKELQRLSQLRKLKITNLRKEDGPRLCSSVEKMRNLMILDVTSTQENEIIDLSSLSFPPSLLKGLYLKAIQALANLVDLQLLEAYEGEALLSRLEGFNDSRCSALKKVPVPYG
ncbi:hypothetical protein Pint_24661 [Pistacia integerrima]|uniref:Uncharacterized protein n=1 Tax=Pistacia integerrima TaxID=434235 RepID=A0ACC0YCI8_9ROSI|nr:hypothetical protein Pint_24661 [Pistacia integerrima]